MQVIWLNYIITGPDIRDGKMSRRQHGPDFDEQQHAKRSTTAPHYGHGG